MRRSRTRCSWMRRCRIWSWPQVWCGQAASLWLTNTSMSWFDLFRKVLLLNLSNHFTFMILRRNLFTKICIWFTVCLVIVHFWSHLHRILDSYCYIDSSQCLAQLTPARVGIARSVHVQLVASPHVTIWYIVCLSPQSHTSVWESFHIFIIARHRSFCTLSRFKLLQLDKGSSVQLAKCSFGMIPLSRQSVD